jgi:hypothetical protein
MKYSYGSLLQHYLDSLTSQLKYLHKNQQILQCKIATTYLEWK